MNDKKVTISLTLNTIIKIFSNKSNSKFHQLESFYLQ